MTAQPHSVIGQMLFRTRPTLALRQLVQDLDRALTPLITPKRNLTWPAADTAHFEFEGGRILIGYDPNPCSPWQGCLTISVGEGTIPGHGRLGRRYATMAHKIAEDISRYHRADDMPWISLPSRCDDDIIKGLVKQLDHATETMAARFRDAEYRRTQGRLPRLDDGLVIAKDQQLRSAFDTERARQKEAEARFIEPQKRRSLHMRMLDGLKGALGQIFQPDPAPLPVKFDKRRRR